MELNPALSELIGAIIGDGNMYFSSKHKKYYFEITGDKHLDKDYLIYLCKLIQKLFNKKLKLYIRGRGLRLRFYSKEILLFLKEDLKMHTGAGKSLNVKIPKLILKNKELMKFCVRGLFDTDGSFFLCNKGYRKDYPCIELGTCSDNLAFQIKDFFINNDFIIGFRKDIRTCYTRGHRYVISFNGDSMVSKYVSEIGFSNPRHNKKLFKLNTIMTKKGLSNWGSFKSEKTFKTKRSSAREGLRSSAKESLVTSKFA
ncbi:MAG: hypothetical protein Q8O03_09385 [Nanoarchaeota archaeon]|nr:hypothetical protein [Nanoarchaeota archaeon]